MDLTQQMCWIKIQCRIAARNEKGKKVETAQKEFNELTEEQKLGMIDFKIDDKKLDSTQKAQKEFDELNEEEKKCIIDFNTNDEIQ